MNILIGADPEVFLVGKDSVPMSAHGVIPGTKAEPHLVDGGALQVDGMALEFNIDPADNVKDFRRNINKVMGQLKSSVKDVGRIKISPTIRFSKEVMEAQPKEALEFGCDPDYNTYTGKQNDTPKCPEGMENMRTAAGHIHIGWTEGVDPLHPSHFEACKMLTRELDIALGIPSLLWDDDRERMKLYGSFGAFRPKPYGMEYRVLSNAWLKKPELINFVYHTAISTFEYLKKNGRVSHALCAEDLTSLLPCTKEEILSSCRSLYIPVPNCVNPRKLPHPYPPTSPGTMKIEKFNQFWLKQTRTGDWNVRR